MTDISSIGKTVKRLAKVVLKVAAIALVVYGAATLVAGAAGAAGAGSAGAAAGTGSMTAAAGSTAAMGGAAAGGGGFMAGLGSAISAMAPATKSALIMTGGNMLSGAMQPTAEEEYRDMRKAQLAGVQGTSGLFDNPQAPAPAPNQPVAQPQAQIAPTNAPQIERPEAQTIAAPQTSSIVRFDPQTGRFVT